MRRFLKYVGYLVATLVVIVAVALAIIYAKSGPLIAKTYSIKVETVAVPTDAAAIAHGKHIAETRGCTHCHGMDLGGAEVYDKFPVGRVHGANITKGAGGKTANYVDEDWTRAIRHGIGKDGHGLYLMPSEEYALFNDDDLGSLIAYLKSVPPVNRETVPVKVGPIARLLLLKGEIKIGAAEIDHTAARPEIVKPGPTVAYGRYMAIGCTGCHGPNFSGGKIPGGDPAWPAAQNLTPAGDLGKWTQDDFVKTLRTYHRPDGTELKDPMPRFFGQLSEDELTALWLFLKTVPPAATGSR